MRTKTVSLAVLLSCLMLVAACDLNIAILGVQQPERKALGQPFESIVRTSLFEHIWGTDNVDTVVFAVNLPEGWQVTDCSALFDGTEYGCNTRDPNFEAFLNTSPLPHNNWYTGVVPNPGGLNPPVPVEVHWTIVPTTAGSFTLDYWAALRDGNVYISTLGFNLLTGIPFNHPIEIFAPVPTISGYATIVFAALLFCAALVFIVRRKKVSGNHLPSTLPFIVVLSVSVLMLGALSNAHAADTVVTKPDLNWENIQAYKESLVQTGGVAPTLPADPRQEIENYFNMGGQQKAFFDQLPDTEIVAVYQTILDAEDMDEVYCLITKDPPSIKCVIIP